MEVDWEWFFCDVRHRSETKLVVRGCADSGFCWGMLELDQRVV